MITGAHAILYSADAEADRAVLAEILRGQGTVDAGGGALGLYEPRHPVAAGT